MLSIYTLGKLLTEMKSRLHIVPKHNTDVQAWKVREKRKDQLSSKKEI